MGVAFILLGLLAVGVVVDFVVENDLSAGHTYALFGGSFRLPESQVVLGAAVLGALAFVVVILGIGLLRGSWGRRRALKRRLVDLERENEQLRSRAHLATAMESTRPEDVHADQPG